MNMRILVTGGAGFIASNLTDAYINQGHEIAILDDLSTGFRHNINAKARFYEVDIRDVAGVDRVFNEFQPEIVNHHAAQMDVRRSTRDPVFDAQCNILGSLNVILAAVRTKVKKFIYISTGGAVYGEVPECHLPPDEDYPVNPISQYGISKHTVEHYLFLYHRLYGLPYTVLRYPNVYGQRQTPHGEAGVVSIFSLLLLSGKPCTIFGDGCKTRDYVFIADVADANLRATTSDFVGILNIGSGRGTSDQQVYDAVADATGSKLKPTYTAVRPGEVEHIYLNATRAKQVLGWTPTVPFPEGVRRTVEYIRTIEQPRAPKS
jgi:UDP-glucose 4-epimerase